MVKPATISNQSDKYDYYDMKVMRIQHRRILDYGRDRISNIFVLRYNTNSQDDFSLLLSAGIN